MQWSWSRLCVAAIAATGSGCGDAVLLEIDGDRPIPDAVDAICVGVADVDESGGHFGRAYRLVDKLGTFPQTLRLEAGGASDATAWVRADRGGVPAARASAAVDFSDDVRLSLAACLRGDDAAPRVVSGPLGPGDARLVSSQGAGGTLVVAVGAEAAVLDAARGALVSAEAPAPPPGPIDDALAVDVDGDCDDDIVVAGTGAPMLWHREGRRFEAVDIELASDLSAIDAADVDADLDVDLVTASGTTLSVWINDGTGAFARDTSKIIGGTRVTAPIRDIALGDVDGDGFPDLVVGQAGGPLLGWLGREGGSFAPADAVIAPVPLDVHALTLADADGDFDPDLAVSVVGARMRLYIDREGRLEEQTFVRFEDPPTTRAVAFGGWSSDCQLDAVVATDTTTLLLRGHDNSPYTDDGMAPAASQVLMTDLDDDGDLDALTASPDGVRWLAR